MQCMTLDTNENVLNDGNGWGSRGNGRIVVPDSNLAEIGSPSITANFAARISRSILGLKTNVLSVVVNLKSC